MFIRLVLVCLLLVAGGGLFAQDGSSRLVFTGCPPELSVNHCDSLFYQVVAVDPATGRVRPGIRYHLISGPGTMNEKTGLWVLHPDIDLDEPYGHYKVEIAASLGGDTTDGDGNCRFGVYVYDASPRFSSPCGAHITVLPFDTARLTIEVSDPDPCDEVTVVLDLVYPEPTGTLTYDEMTAELAFIPDAADSGQSFEVTLSILSSSRPEVCHLYFDTEPPDPIRFSLERVEGATTGDTVRVDIVVEKSPVGFGQIELLVEHNTTKLRFLEATAGPAFFDSTTGCAWEYFGAGRISKCGGDFSQSLLRVGARAERSSSPPHPACYIPDSLPATFATLEFEVLDDGSWYDSFSPLSFYWCDCRNNAVLSPDRRIWYYPLAVYDHNGQLIPAGEIPGYSGASDEFYLGTTSYGERYRQVEFYNGGVQILADSTLEAAYTVRIENETGYDGKGVIQGTVADVDLILEEIDTNRGLGGFDLLMTYDVAALSFQGAVEGDLITDCGWEYFTYRFGPNTVPCNQCPPGIVRVVALADINNGPYYPNPDCQLTNPGWVGELPATLATMQFLVTNDRTYEGSFVPIGFFWSDCGDNTLSSFGGTEIYLSAHVWGNDTLLIPVQDTFPTLGGATTECILPGQPNPPMPNIHYYNGGIQIWCSCCCPGCGAGDINLNGVAFELGDAVMFANYFVEGVEALGSDPDIVAAAIAASDVHADGIPLAVADFVYLMRIVHGSTSPIPQLTPSPNIAHFLVDQTAKVVSVASPDSLGAVHLIFRGAIQPTLLADGMQMRYGYDSGSTRILIHPPLDETGIGAYISSGPLLSYSGGGVLVEANTATYSGRPVNTAIGMPTDVDDANNNLPASFELLQNYPNPFNPVTAIEYALPQRTSVQLVIYNIAGQVVTTLIDEVQPPGYHTIYWDGRGRTGNPVSSGIYLYRLTASEFTKTRKMILLK